MARAFLLVMDSFGIGNAPDAAKFGDEGLVFEWVSNELVDGESLACDIADRITF